MPYKDKAIKAIRESIYKARPAYRAKHRRHHRLNRYGITQAEYNALMGEQNGLCAICGMIDDGKALAVDHNHLTGKNRALLCVRCNTGLGYFLDSPELLALARLYLIKWRRTAA